MNTELPIEEWTALHERVQAARYSGNQFVIAQVIEDLDQHTSDGTPIRYGLAVIDYNRRTTTVVNVQSVEINGTVWFGTENGGMFDGSRLEAVRP